jgi:TonB-linked SusC/RagA family outer membrane protein
MKMKKRLRHMAMIAITIILGLGAHAQEKTTKGKVSDASNNPLPGVTVTVKGSHVATTTDGDGAFTIKANESDVLVFSSVGFSDVEMKAGKPLSIVLRQSTTSLNEVVVMGYGTQKQKDVTGSTVTIRTDNLPKVANTSINDLLQGQAAGLNLSLNSAQPGGSLHITIRGGLDPASATNPSPLYVVDGVPLFNLTASEPAITSGGSANEVGFSGGINRDPLNSINPSDVESVTVLKDASAAAIYGSAAASGVILITTKKGKADGKVNTEYRGSYTWETPKKYLQFLDAKDFETQQVRISYDQYLYNGGFVPYGNTPAAPGFTPLYSPAQIASAGAGTDWLGLLMRKGSIQEHNVTVSGGSEKTQIYTSFNYYDNKALLNNSDYLRFAGRVNLVQKINNFVKLSVDLNVSQINSNNASSGAGGQGEKYNSLQSAYAFSPALPVFDNTGNYTKTLNTEIMNPAAFLIIQDKLQTKNFFLTPNIEAKILKDLKVNVVGGVSQSTSNREFYLPIKAQNFLYPDGVAQLSWQTVQNYSAEGYGTYTHSFGDHNLTLIGGGGYYKGIQEFNSMQGVGFFTDALGYNNIGLATNVAQNFVQSNRNPDLVKISQFFRANYDYKSKYILTFNIRRDASSSFATNLKAGIFPGGSAAWRISDESFMSNSKTISDLKLRVGYGEVGQDANLNALALYTAGTGGSFLIGNTYFPSVSLSQLASPNLSWETVSSANIGLDYGLFKNRIIGTIEYFKKDRKNIDAIVQLPIDNAVSQFNVNLGAQSSQGVEFSVTTKNFQGAFTWETNFNISTYSNHWTKRNPYTALAPYQQPNDRTDAVFGWETNGIIQNAAERPGYMPNASLGNIIYKDQNKSGSLGPDDVVKLGYSSPAWSFGFGNKFTYKNFDLNIFMYGSLHQYLNNNLAGFFSPARIAGTSGQNVTQEIKNAWSNDNPTGTLPGFAPNPYDGGNPTGFNNFYAKNINFMRIKDLVLGYTVNTPRIIRSARFFLDFQNLAMLTNYKGFDPELAGVPGPGEGNPYPEALSTTIGVNINF